MPTSYQAAPMASGLDDLLGLGSDGLLGGDTTGMFGTTSPPTIGGMPGFGVPTPPIVPPAPAAPMMPPAPMAGSGMDLLFGGVSSPPSSGFGFNVAAGGYVPPKQVLSFDPRFCLNLAALVLALFFRSG